MSSYRKNSWIFKILFFVYGGVLCLYVCVCGGAGIKGQLCGLTSLSPCTCVTVSDILHEPQVSLPIEPPFQPQSKGV